MNNSAKTIELDNQGLRVLACAVLENAVQSITGEAKDRMSYKAAHEACTWLENEGMDWAETLGLGINRMAFWCKVYGALSKRELSAAIESLRTEPLDVQKEQKYVQAKLI